jgi:hypothetical protein
MPTPAIAEAASRVIAATQSEDPEAAAFQALAAEYERRAAEAPTADDVAAVASELKTAGIPEHFKTPALVAIRATWKRKAEAAA